MSKQKFASATLATQKKAGKGFGLATLRMEQYFGPAFRNHEMDYEAELANQLDR